MKLGVWTWPFTPRPRVTPRRLEGRFYLKLFIQNLEFLDLEFKIDNFHVACGNVLRYRCIKSLLATEYILSCRYFETLRRLERQQPLILEKSCKHLVNDFKVNAR